jgi:hypothetical protein
VRSNVGALRSNVRGYFPAQPRTCARLTRLCVRPRAPVSTKQCSVRLNAHPLRSNVLANSAIHLRGCGRSPFLRSSAPQLLLQQTRGRYVFYFFVFFLFYLIIYLFIYLFCPCLFIYLLFLVFSWLVYF